MHGAKVDGHGSAVKDDGRVQHLSEDVGVLGGVLGGGGQQQRAGSRGQTRGLRCECSFQARGQRQPRRQQGARIEVLGPQRGGQFDERERVACGFLEQPLAHSRSKARRTRIQQPRGGLVAQPVQSQLGQPGFVEWVRESVAHGDQHEGRLGHQPPRDKRQHGTAGLVEPLSVLDNQQNGRAFSGVADQFKGREPGHEQLRSSLLRHAERGMQRGLLACGQALGQVKDRP